MYDPKGNGKDKAISRVLFAEAEPPERLRSIVHRFIELKTDAPLAADYRFHALPDACTYIVLDQTHPDIAGVTRLRASSEEFNLGRSFSFINIRFLPGVWQTSAEPICYGLLDQPYAGQLPLVVVNRSLAGKSFDQMQATLCGLVDTLAARGLVVANPVTEKIFAQMEEIHSVADMAEAAQLSPRQLQRRLKSTAGFTPHDFLKVLRLQQALAAGDIKGESLSYADQSHFIHSFRKATGYTPVKYAKKFDV